MIQTSVSLSAFRPPQDAPVLFHGDLDICTAQIRELGFKGVDLFIRDPMSEDSRKAKRAITQENLGVGVVMPAAMASAGLFLGDPSAEIRDKIISKMKEIIFYAGEIGGMVSLGLVRGSMRAGDTRSAFMKRFANSIARLLPTAEQCGVDLLIEPINRYEINTLNSSIEAYDFIQEHQLPVYLLLDTFHMNIEDVSLEECFKKCMPIVKHVHFLDSNRLAPGMGHMDMTGLYHLLVGLGYQGFLCLEALPQPNGWICAKKGREFFERVSDSHGSDALHGRCFRRDI